MTGDPVPLATSTLEHRWQARFRAARVSLPDWARDAPHRCAYVSNASGTYELYTWDRHSGRRLQATHRPHGTTHGALDPNGQRLWWFDDTAGDEFGIWRWQRFGSGAEAIGSAPPAADGIETAYPAGLALGRRHSVIGSSTAAGSRVHLVAPHRPPRCLYQHQQDANVVGLSRDEDLVCVSHSEHGDALHPALRVFDTDGRTVAELWDGPGLALWGVGFSPVRDDPRYLASHERTGRGLPVVWNPRSGTELRITVDLPGEITPDWYPDASALLLRHDHRGRTSLHRYDLVTGALDWVSTPAGTISAATARPDGGVELAWSSAASPPAIRDLAGRTVLAAAGEQAPESVPVTDVFVDCPAGPVHALVARPPGGAPPYPAVFLVHGGPMAHDQDAFAPARAAWVDHGYAVVQVNYRGSTGYGAAWRDAIEGLPGLTELEDIRAVRDWAVADGLADPRRLVLTGGSWGGYLTLLGLGTQPQAWSLGIAAVPVADYAAAYEDEMEALKATDRVFFGGSPDQVPQIYRRCSPLTYAEHLRAPLLVLAGVNDPRCPIRQIENYLARLVEVGVPHEVYRFDAGHGSLVVQERIRQMAAELDFAARHLPRQ